MFFGQVFFFFFFFFKSDIEESCHVFFIWMDFMQFLNYYLYLPKKITLLFPVPKFALVIITFSVISVGGSKWLVWAFIRFIQRFIQEEWLSLWVSLWFVHSTDLFEHTDSFRNETSNCEYKWAIDLFTQLICLNIPIHSGIKQVIVNINEPLIRSLNWFVWTHWFIHEWNK